MDTSQLLTCSEQWENTGVQAGTEWGRGSLKNLDLIVSYTSTHAHAHLFLIHSLKNLIFQD